MESNRRISHQSSNGDLHHCVNREENPALSNNHQHVIHNLDHGENDVLQKNGEKNLICGMRWEVLKPTLVMCAWFFCSFMTIMLNKYILSSLDTDPGVLGEFQIVVTTILGFVAMYLPCHILKKPIEKNPENFSKVAFLRAMTILGFLRQVSINYFVIYIYTYISLRIICEVSALTNTIDLFLTIIYLFIYSLRTQSSFCHHLFCCWVLFKHLQQALSYFQYFPFM